MNNSALDWLLDLVFNMCLIMLGVIGVSLTFVFFVVCMCFVVWLIRQSVWRVKYGRWD